MDNVKDIYKGTLEQIEKQALMLCRLFERWVPKLEGCGFQQQSEVLVRMRDDLHQRLSDANESIDDRETCYQKILSLMTHLEKVASVISSCQPAFDKFITTLERCDEEVRQVEIEIQTLNTLGCGMSHDPCRSRTTGPTHAELQGRLWEIYDRSYAAKEQLKAELDPQNSPDLAEFGFTSEYRDSS